MLHFEVFTVHKIYVFDVGGAVPLTVGRPIQLVQFAHSERFSRDIDVFTTQIVDNFPSFLVLRVSHLVLLL